MSKSVDEIIDATLHDDYEATPEEIGLVLARLSPHEKKWRDRYLLLKAEGYELRPRLRPDWKPSWFESGVNPLLCEDGAFLPVGFL